MVMFGNGLQAVLAHFHGAFTKGTQMTARPDAVAGLAGEFPGRARQRLAAGDLHQASEKGRRSAAHTAKLESTEGIRPRQ